GNGNFDSGEMPLGGVTVTLNTGAMVITAADGSYTFADLAAGSYTVTAPDTTGGKKLSTPNPRTVSITGGEHKGGNNFGYVLGSIVGNIYCDMATTPPPCASCLLAYPYVSANPRTSIVFNENEVLRGFSTSIVGQSDTIKVWYSDEHALLLGIRKVIVKTAGGSTTNDYPVTPQG